MRFTLYIHKSFSVKLAPTSDHEGVGGIHCQPPLRKISAPKREVVTAPLPKEEDGGGWRTGEGGRRWRREALNAFGQVRRLVI